MAIGIVKSLFLGLFLNKGFDHPDPADVFLNDGIELVQALLQDGKQGVGTPDDENHVDENQRKRAGDNYAERQIQTQKRRRAANEKHQAAHKAADHLHDQLLNLGNIVGDAGDERAGREIVRLLKGKVHDLLKAGLSDVVSVALPGYVGEHAGEHAAHSTGNHHQDHANARRYHKIQIRNAVAAQS